MKLVAVSACTAGIAHTYMTQEAIEQECKKRGIDCKVETQGGMGINNELEQDEIDAADVVILAIAIGIEGDERFDEKRDAGKVIEVDPTQAIKDIKKLIDRAEALANE
ncbi:MAG: PTS fructose transporter subunit IIBC [Solobacterium sp.]|jgi:PTS system, fru family, IIB component|uniref:PTS fructose transporter subunit IIB n=1 Tax=Solobacterium moorei TaxID=102148 RepID=UPI000404F52F|nr:fructose PTS transporter subunit IIB [Solobacterium moorei]MBF1114988.1 PTS fructose transporter subunit IIBC [Solobacterium sp.]MBF1123237.1 PTS fructose transporter subunit IIBC [Solobacterium sp.]MBF1124878.1 PTS fructose transporter subunit IIBC [Solobacterium sp.]BET20541.1 PTS fructose transporter subunit IIB [Solobacterium moorei]